jgi:hypothetical protein
MTETDVAKVLVGDPMDVSFPRFYTVKAFTTDAGRLRDILRLQTRQVLSEVELGEVAELRKKLKRIDADVAMMLVIKTRLNGGHNWF